MRRWLSRRRDNLRLRPIAKYKREQGELSDYRNIMKHLSGNGLLDSYRSDKVVSFRHKCASELIQSADRFFTLGVNGYLEGEEGYRKALACLRLARAFNPDDKIYYEITTIKRDRVEVKLKDVLLKEAEREVEEANYRLKFLDTDNSIKHYEKAREKLQRVTPNRSSDYEIRDMLVKIDDSTREIKLNEPLLKNAEELLSKSNEIWDITFRWYKNALDLYWGVMKNTENPHLHGGIAYKVLKKAADTEDLVIKDTFLRFSKRIYERNLDIDSRDLIRFGPGTVGSAAHDGLKEIHKGEAHILANRVRTGF